LMAKRKLLVSGRERASSISSVGRGPNWNNFLTN